MSDNSVLTKKEGKLGIITLNRPENFNTFTVEFAEKLNQALIDFDNDDDVVIIIINANGKHFCVGIDLNSFKYSTEEEYIEFIKLMDKHNHTIFNMKKPVISSVQGLAIANGAGLSYACDMTVAAESAKFGTTAINVGLICTGPGAPLSKEVSRKRAMEMVLRGDMFGAQEAYELGLVNKVVSDDKLYEETIEFANIFAEKSPLALQAGKRGLCDAYAIPYHDAVDKGSILFAKLCNTEDAKEGLKAFSEKRKPNWKLK